MKSRKIVAVASLVVGCGCAALPEPAELARQQREAMAVAHDKMAACLRSQRPLVECRAELAQASAGVEGKTPAAEHACCKQQERGAQQGAHEGH